ncbi:MAG TPA: TetR/AcrR family transcriptional regulator [Candidatus Cybelea sp.]|nr:TetR/AcrR family transcriptional regulator [Candidatus Cybelea sp.]
MSDAKATRRKSAHEQKRQALLGAAFEVFKAQGISGLTMRSVAVEAGYVAGAIYAYFPSRDAMLGELLVQSLTGLARIVKAAASGNDPPADRLRRGVQAVCTYYSGNPHDLELAAAAFAALSPDLQRQVNGRLIGVLQPLASALEQAAQIEARAAERETVALAAGILGTLLLDAAGRLAPLNQSGAAIVDHIIEGALRRLTR